MLIKYVKKLWQGKYASVRDYEVAAALKENGMEIRYGDNVMVLTTDDLKLYKPGDRTFASKFGKPYKLVDIPFYPREE